MHGNPIVQLLAEYACNKEDFGVVFSLVALTIDVMFWCLVLALFITCSCVGRVPGSSSDES